MSLTIRTKFFLGMVAVALSFILLSFLVMDRFVGSIARNEGTNTLRRGLRAYERFIALNYSLIAAQTRSTAQAPHLRAVMDIPDVDHATVLYTATELGKVAESDLMLLVSTEARLLADVDDTSGWNRDLSALPGIAAGLNGREYTGVWQYQDRLYWVSLTPVVTGEQILGLLALGNLIDAEAAAQIREFTGQDVLIFQGDRLTAQSWEAPDPPPVDQRRIEQFRISWAQRPAGTPFRTTLGAREVLAVAVPFGDGAGHAVLFRGLDELESGVQALRTSILVAALASMVLAVALGLWLSARVSRPIRQLRDAAEQFGGGRFSTRVAVHSQDEVGQLEHSFNLMAAQIEERTKAVRLESMGRLSAGIAHEINTPMQFIGDNTYFLRQAFAELLRVLQSCRELLVQNRNGSVSAEVVDRVEAEIAAADLDFLAARIPQALQRSQEGVEKVSQLVGAMKEFSHPGAREQVPVDLNRTIESAVILSRNEWKYLADLTLDLDQSLPQVRCLAGEISQVLVNLIVNAAHAIGDVVGDGSAGKGTITIGTRFQGERVEVRVQDTGPGIPEDVQQHIFEPFFTTKEVGKGTGQGLAIAHDMIVTKHGGELFFETHSGTGTTFVIRLPVDGNDGPPPRREAEA